MPDSRTRRAFQSDTDIPSAQGVRCDPKKTICGRFTSTEWQTNQDVLIAKRSITKLVRTADQPLMSRITTTWNGTVREKHSLHFFCTISAYELSGYLDRTLWLRLLPRATHFDAAIKHIIAAIGASHEVQLRKQANRLTTEIVELSAFALRQCNKAISALLAPGKGRLQDLIRAVTVSVLFAEFESTDGNRDGAIPHVSYSRRLLDQVKTLKTRNDYHGRPSYSEAVPVEHLEPLVAHFEVQTGAYSYIAGEEALNAVFDTKDLGSFDTLGDARIVLERAVASLGVLVVSTEGRDLDDAAQVTGLQSVKLEYVRWLQQWETAYSSLLTCLRTELNAEMLDGCRVLKAHHVAATVVAETDITKGEAQWQDFAPHCKAIVGLAAEVVERLPNARVTAQVPQVPYISSTMGLTEPLYVAATRCHDPTIANHAKVLLHRLPLNEGAHSSWRLDLIERTLCACTGKPWPRRLSHSPVCSQA